MILDREADDESQVEWGGAETAADQASGVTSVEREALLAPLLRADLTDAEVELWTRALS
jgi:hypothetical protein